MARESEDCCASVDLLQRLDSDSVRKRTECNREGFHVHRSCLMRVQCESVLRSSSADWPLCPTVNDECSARQVDRQERSRWRYQ